MNEKRVVGIFLICLSVLWIILSSFKITGFVVLENLNVNVTFVLSLVFFILGMVLFVAGLERKVEEKPEERPAIIFVSGLLGKRKDYLDFVNTLNEHYRTEMIALKAGGISGGEAMVKQFIKDDEDARKRLGTDRIIYIGHSLGFKILAEAERRTKRPAIAHIALATYPSVGDCINADKDPSRKTLLQKAMSYFPNYSIFSFPQSELPKTKYIVPRQDDNCFFVRPRNKVRRRFVNTFNRERAETVVIRGNHCYNKGRKLAPFNADHPENLTKEIFDYIEKVGE